LLNTIRKLLELIRFSHTLFALPFALLAAVMAWYWCWEEHTFVVESIAAIERGGSYVHIPTVIPSSPRWTRWRSLDGSFSFGYPIGNPPDAEREYPGFQWQDLIGILFCMVFARSAAMAFNRIADRNIDAANPRTAERHLPRGDLNAPTATAFAVACSLAFIASTSFFLPNRLPLYLSVPVLLFLLGYSFAKRFTALSHVWLGTALALSPVAVWIAIRGEVVLQHPVDLLPAVVLGAAVLTWVTGFDIIYACQDAEFDREAKLHSIPAKLGIPVALRLAAVCHVLTIAFLAALPFVYPPFGGIYCAGVALVGVLLVYEHAIVRPGDLTRVNVAFFNVNAVISFGLFAVGTLDLLVGSG
jgi:4-hydroxybenzoate polyprenyltransferase